MKNVFKIDSADVSYEKTIEASLKLLNDTITTKLNEAIEGGKTDFSFTMDDVYCRIADKYGVFKSMNELGYKLDIHRDIGLNPCAYFVYVSWDKTENEKEDIDVILQKYKRKD